MARCKKGSADNLPVEKKKRPPREGHGLYRNPNKTRIDGRSHFARQWRKLSANFLEGFNSPTPRAMAIAHGAAFNCLVLEAFRASLVRGEVAAPSVWKDYCALQHSLARDLSALEVMVKEGGPANKGNDLQEYLRLKAAAADQIEVGDNPGPEPVTPGEESAKKRTLF